MPEEKLTTIQIDVETRDKLRVLGEAYERSAVGQLRWLVNQDWLKLKALKLLPKVSPSPQPTSTDSAQPSPVGRGGGKKAVEKLPKGA